MLKNMLVCLVCCLTYGDAIGTDIFGLKKGMTVSQIRALGFDTLTMSRRYNDYFSVLNPKMPKDAYFAHFVISPKDGLLGVSFKWDERKNSFDTLKRKYIEIRDILIRTYGKAGLRQVAGRVDAFDLIDSLSVVANPASREFWRKSDFDADNKWQLENLRLELSKKIAKNLELQYHFQGYSQYRTAKYEAEKAKREAKKAKEAGASPF